MTIERTLAIIKPDAVAKGVAGQILARIENAGFKVRDTVDSTSGVVRSSGP